MDIRYAILHFTIEFDSFASLPRYKGSTIRGGMGEMLFTEYCVQEHLRQEDKCEECGFRKECVPQRIMYAPMDLPVKSMNTGSSEGYVVECEDVREQINAGDQMEFRILLIGKVAGYLSPILSAIYRLGMAGIGKDHAGFQVVSVKNGRGEDILDGRDIYKQNYRIETLDKHLERRMRRLSEQEGDVLEIHFLTPVAIKKDQKILESPTMDDILFAAERRVHILRSFEGIPSAFPKAIPEYTEGLKVLETSFRPTAIPRYSFRKSTKSNMRGSYGSLRISLTDCRDEDRIRILRTLLAGELFHIGSSTSFGFGRYTLKLCNKNI